MWGAEMSRCRQGINMKKALRLLLALSLVGALFTAGFAGTAAAGGDNHKKWWANQEQSSWQYANSEVDQEQYVVQANSNQQSFAIAVSLNGDAEAEQGSEQSNTNVQYADSEAENENVQWLD